MATLTMALGFARLRSRWSCRLINEVLYKSGHDWKLWPSYPILARFLGPDGIHAGDRMTSPERPATSFVIRLHGLCGSGKTTLAGLLARELDATIFEIGRFRRRGRAEPD